MACTKDGVFHDLKESTYILNKYIGNDFIQLYFSSEFNLTRFNKRIDNYVTDENIKFGSKYNCKCDMTCLLYISLYRMIEKRGFYIILNNQIIKEVNGILKVGVK